MASAEKEETRRLVGVGPATPVFYKLDTRAKKAKAKEKAKQRQQTRWKEAERVTPRGYEAMKTYCSADGTASSEARLPECESVVGYPVLFLPAEETAPRRGCNWLRLLPFPRPDPHPIRRTDKLTRAEHTAILRARMPRSQIRALSRKTLLQCLEWYNSKHPDDEYEAVPGGAVTRCSEFYKSRLWTHGNFVARRKRSGCFSFLPAPRTLFFYELLEIDGVNEVITCTPIDEPVTEAYTFLGLPLGWGTRRNGGGDCVCKTCYRQFHVPHIGLKRTCPCGESKVESVCKMCYLRSDVLHPVRGGFACDQVSFAKIC